MAWAPTGKGHAIGIGTADVDDPTASGHVPGGGLGGDEHAAHVDGQGLVEVFEFESSNGATASTPALLTRISSCPKASTVAVTAPQARRSALSALMARALPPSAMMLFCNASALAVELT
jgi:hypothetical protein